MFSVSKNQVEKHQFLITIVATNGFFMNLCFAKCEKSSFFWGLFCQILVVLQKHYKIGISAHKKHFSKLLIGTSLSY